MNTYIEVTSPKKLLKNSIEVILSSKSKDMSLILKSVFSFSPFKLIDKFNFLSYVKKHNIKLFHSFSSNFLIASFFTFLIINSPGNFRSIVNFFLSEIINLTRFISSFLFPKYLQILKFIFMAKL